MRTMHFNTQISPTFINEQTMHACVYGCQQLISLFSRGCFLRRVRHPQVLKLSLIVLLAVIEKPPGCKLPHDWLVMLSTNLATFGAIYSTNDGDPYGGVTT